MKKFSLKFNIEMCAERYSLPNIFVKKKISSKFTKKKKKFLIELILIESVLIAYKYELAILL